MSKRYSVKSFKDSSVKKNLNLVSKKKGNLNEKSEKILNLFKPSVVFFKFSKAIKYV